MRAVKKAWVHADQIPLLTPDSSWQALPQVDWPDLKDAKYVGFDTETTDPFLVKQGPGFIRGDASVCGFSFATELGHKLYLPIGHSEGNVDRDQAIRYAKAQLKRPEQTKVGANLMYDLEAAWSLGIELKGPLGDIQIAEPLLNEDREGGYSLETLAQAYLGKGKTEGLLREAEAAYNVDHKKGMAKLPAKYVGLYAEDDADEAIQVFLKQLKLLSEEDLMPIFKLEQDLMPVLFAMRLKGVRVDLEAAEKLAKDTRLVEEELTRELEKDAGWNLNPFSSKDVAAVLEPRGFSLPYTKPTKAHPLGQISVTNEWLELEGGVDKTEGTATGDHFCATLYELRRINKMRKDFVEGAILGQNVNGRLHPCWHQLRDFDEEAGRTRGTRSGRVAASRPNLTQVPARDPVWGKRIRRLFIADEGKTWVKRDYSQQEPRLLLHFAYILDQLPISKGGCPMPGAAEARQRYIDDPTTDYHEMTRQLIKERAGKDIARRPAKDINLGGAYGMGKFKLKRKLNVAEDLAEEILIAYHLGVPYVKRLERFCTDRAVDKGFIRTILGRKRRFNRWEDRRARFGPDDDRNITVGSFEEACEKWGAANVGRALVHKALNALVQGSAADQMKKALVLLHAEDLTPQLQVYDEVDGSYDLDPVQMRRATEIMTYCIDVTVPHLVEPEVGPSWGELEDWVDVA